MAESPAKKQCVVAVGSSEVKVEVLPIPIKVPVVDKMSDSETVKDRLYHASHLVMIDTKPPLLLPNTFIKMSDKLTKLAAETCRQSSSQAKKNKYGDMYLLCLPHDDISVEHWKLINSILIRFTLEKFEIDDYLFDSIMYIIDKYEIDLLDFDDKKKEKFVSMCKTIIMKPQKFRKSTYYRDENMAFLHHLIHESICSASNKSKKNKQLRENVPFIYELIAYDKLQKQFEAKD